MRLPKKRGAVVATAAAGVLAVALPAWAYLALTSNTDNASFTAASLVAPTGPTATVVSSSRVDLAWSAASQLSGAEYVVTNTLDNHVACTVTATTCSDTAALPGVVNTYSVKATLPGSSWASNATAFQSAATPSKLTLTTTANAAIPAQTAGTSFAVRITAQRWSNGSLVTDTAYTSPPTRTMTWSGLANSPDGTTPTYPVSAVTFTNGVSTTALNATAVKAGSTTLSVTDGTRAGSATFTVNAAGAALRFTSGTPSCDSGSIAITQTGTFVAKVSRDQDTYGNTATFTGTPTVTVSVPNGAKGSVSGGSLTFGSATNAETTASFTYNASGKDANGVTITASAPGYVSGTCVSKQN